MRDLHICSPSVLLFLHYYACVQVLDFMCKMWGLTHLHVWQKAIWQIERACWLLGVWFHSWNSMLWGVQRILHWLIFICEIVALVIEQAIFFFPKPIWLIFSPFFLLRSFIFLSFIYWWSNWTFCQNLASCFEDNIDLHMLEPNKQRVTGFFCKIALLHSLLFCQCKSLWSEVHHQCLKRSLKICAWWK